MIATIGKHGLSIACAACLVIGATACSKKVSEPRPMGIAQSPTGQPAPNAPDMPSARKAPGLPPVPPVEVAESRAIFESRCSPCHGRTGEGNGPAAAALNPKPRNYTDRKWQASITDKEIAETIVQGGKAMGKSQMMPPNPDLKDRPKVVAGLVKIVRAFGK